MHLIDPPSSAMRSQMDDDGLAQLAADIARNGLIYPLIVTRNGARWNVIAGHRRYIACQMIGRERVECRDFTDVDVDKVGITMRENLQREDVNDADVAMYLQEQIVNHGKNMDDLMSMTGKSQQWCDSRIGLMQGYKEVFESLHAGQINFSQAVELNKFKLEHYGYYLKLALNNQPSAKTLGIWRRDAESVTLPDVQGQQPGEQPVTASPLPGVVIDPCFICESTELLGLTTYVRIHHHCAEMVKKALANANRGE